MNHKTCSGRGTEGLSSACAASKMNEKIFQATMSLRWYKPIRDEIGQLIDAMNGVEPKVLQQAFCELSTGEIEWRDIPSA